jgi:hypothetical protein
LPPKVVICGALNNFKYQALDNQANLDRHSDDPRHAYRRKKRAERTDQGRRRWDHVQTSSWEVTSPCLPITFNVCPAFRSSHPVEAFRYHKTPVILGWDRLGHGNELRDRTLTILTPVTQLSNLRSFRRLGRRSEGKAGGILLQRQLRYVALAMMETLSPLVSFAPGIVMAPGGFAYWAPVCSTNAASAINTASTWRPGMPVDHNKPVTTDKEK